MQHSRLFRAGLLLACLSNMAQAQWAPSETQLLGTPGISQVEGAAGGGLVPWAQLAGYAGPEEVALSGFCSRATLDDYSLDACGVQLNLFNRAELSAARQSFRVDALDTDLEQSVYGAKFRLYGDIVYSPWPQVSAGFQHKQLRDDGLPRALGAQDDSDTDWYVAASKLHLGALAGYNWFWNITARHTRANQMGLLGFGGPANDGEWQLEASSAVFLNRHLAVGAEYRQKPDNLGLGEQDWRDVFVAWFPDKRVNVTAAWVDLGRIAGADDQQGWFLSITGSW